MQRSLFCAVALFATSAAAYDARWPDYGLELSVAGDSGNATYFQGFESPCFTAPYLPGTDVPDWIRAHSEITPVAHGSGGIPARSGFFRADLTPPLPGAPDPSSGAFTRLGGYRTDFGGGYTVEVDVYFDLSDPRVTSGINANYGWDVSAASSTPTGGHRRDFIFHTANNVAGQILVGSSNNSTFSPRTNLAMGPHFVVTTSGWYVMQWVFRQLPDNSLAVDTNLRSGTGTLLWTRTLNNATDQIGTTVGGNRYLWFLFLQTQRLAIDNARLNSNVVEPFYGSTPAPGATVNAGTALVGATTSTTLTLSNTGGLGLEVCSCTLTGAHAADFTIAGCPAVVAPASTLPLTVSCTPSTFGPRSALLTVTTNDRARGTTFGYPLACTGLGAPPVGSAPVPAMTPLGAMLLGLALALVGWLAAGRLAR